MSAKRQMRRPRMLPEKPAVSCVRSVRTSCTYCSITSRPSGLGSAASARSEATSDIIGMAKNPRNAAPWFDIISRAFPQFYRLTVVTFASFADQDFHELLQIDETILV